jgi:hypothetical protein
MNRRCTDVFFCIFFVLFMFGMAGCFAYAFIRGEPGKLITGWDADLMGCGVNETTKDYPYLYWYEIPGSSILDDLKGGNFTAMVKILKHGTCVKQCPTNDTSIAIECA